MPETRQGARTRVRVRTVQDGEARERTDQLVTEEPLEIRLAQGGTTRTLAVTMRTPGHDFELAAGFLLSEGLIGSAAEIREIRYCLGREAGAEQRYNVVTVEVHPRPRRGAGGPLELQPLDRHFFTNSACGVCGKAGIDALSLRGCRPAPPGPVVPAEVIYSLPERLHGAQSIFHATGGLHAAALFHASGERVATREDVGRHNAVDKLIGWAALAREIPLCDRILMVSGRASYEIAQKAAVAGLPILCAGSAPSSLAVDVARSLGLTLIGFLRGRRFNVYTGRERIAT